MKQNIIGIINQMKQIHFGESWIGVNFKNKIKDLSTTDFFYQPNGIHSIAEIISHLTTWRLETILKIKTGCGSITDDDPSNWRSNEELKKIGKAEIIRMHSESLSELLEILENKNNNFFEDLYYDTDFKGNYPYSFVVQGMLHHDLYHLGQIGILIQYIRSNLHE